MIIYVYIKIVYYGTLSTKCDHRVSKKNQNVNKMNVESASTATKLDIADRVDGYMEANALITIKDHKPAFPERVECRLLNPAKSNIWRVRKQFLDETVAAVKIQTISNQWKNYNQVFRFQRI